MDQYTYKVVPFRGDLRQGFSSTDPVDKVSQLLEELINRHASSGWQFYSMETVTLRISRGCLFGGQQALATYDQVIFRRPLSQFGS